MSALSSPSVSSSTSRSGLLPTKTRQPVYLPSLLVMLLDGDAHRHGEDLVGEDGHLVGLAVAVGVFEDLDLVGVVDPVELRVAARVRR